MGKLVFNDKNYSGEPNPINDSIISTNTTWSSDKINNNKMDKVNPTGTGSLSLNRKADTTIGTNSVAEGYDTTASGADSHAEGSYTIAAGSSQHAGGKYNVADNNNTYAEIIGNGTANDARSNARTLDWSGNESLAGTIDASGFGTRLSALIPDIPTPTASDIDKVIKVESDGEGGAQYALGQLLVGGRIRVNYNVTLFDQSATTWVDSLTYTATQDCFVTAIVKGDGYSSPLVYVNEENIPFFTDTDNFQHETTLILKKGDTISKRITSDVKPIFYRFIAYPIYYDNGGHDYSTTEQVIGTWIDGSPVYEKTQYISALPSSTGDWVNYPHGISNFDRLISVSATAYNSTVPQQLNIPHVSAMTGVSPTAPQIAISVSETNIAFIVGQDRSSWEAYVTIRYTKSST